MKSGSLTLPFSSYLLSLAPACIQVRGCDVGAVSCDVTATIVDFNESGGDVAFLHVLLPHKVREVDGESVVSKVLLFTRSRKYPRG